MAYGHEMIKAGFSIKGKKVEDLIEEDIKTFRANDKMVGISQIFTMDYEDIKDNMGDFMQHIEDLASGKFDTVIVLITDIEKNGSYVFFDEKSKYILEEVFKNNNFQQGEYIQDLLSRKKQLVPFVLEILEK
jgi:manganese-dependent inorganic pyrophosphatase